MPCYKVYYSYHVVVRAKDAQEAYEKSGEVEDQPPVKVRVVKLKR